MAACGLGSIPGLGVICGLSLWLVFVLAPRGFSSGTPVFPSPQKPTFPNSDSIWIIVKHFIMSLGRVESLERSHENLTVTDAAFGLQAISPVKPATHLAILYADRRDRRIKSPISGMSDIGD